MAVKEAQVNVKADANMDTAKKAQKGVPTGPLAELCELSGVTHIRLPRLGTLGPSLAYADIQDNTLSVYVLEDMDRPSETYTAHVYDLRYEDREDDFEIGDTYVSLHQKFEDQDAALTMLAQIMVDYHLKSND